jgi:hypothetical protein
MQFIAGHEDHVPGGDRVPPALAKNLPRPGMDKHFVFPLMGVQGGMSGRRNLKDPQIKIGHGITLTQDHAGGDPFGLIVIETGGLDCGIFFDLHKLSMVKGPGSAVELGPRGFLCRQLAYDILFSISKVYFRDSGLPRKNRAGIQPLTRPPRGPLEKITIGTEMAGYSFRESWFSQ